MSGLLGRKIGMTQVFDEKGDIVPVTVIQAGPCFVVQKKTKDTDGYDAIQVGFEEIAEKKQSRLAKAYLGHFKKKNSKVFRFIKEFTGDIAAFEVGQEINVGSLKQGDMIKLIGESKGKGFQGVIKRHGKAGGPASHGSRFHRTTGSIGQRTSPGEVFKNMKLPGHMGDDRVTLPHVKVVQVRAEDNLVFVKGAVPGAKNSLVIIRK